MNEICDITEKAVRPYSLVYLRDGENVLLAKRPMTKKYYPGKWVGLGGKIEPGESMEACAVREFREETGLTIHHPVFRGVLNWITPTWTGAAFIYTATSHEGELLKEGPEGELAWQPIENVANMKDFPGSHKVYLPIIFNTTDFYYGMAIYSDHKLIQYADNHNSPWEKGVE